MCVLRIPTTTIYCIDYSSYGTGAKYALIKQVLFNLTTGNIIPIEILEGNLFVSALAYNTNEIFHPISP